jgi:hypothetical protein
VRDHENVWRLAVANEPRIWGARRVQNYDLRSDYSSGWARVSGLIHPDPFGGNQAVLMTTAASTTYGSFTRSPLDSAWPNLHVGRTILFSTYVKAGTATHVGIRLGAMGSGSFDEYTTFNLTTGAKQDNGTSGGTYTAAGAINVGDGWWRVWMYGVSPTALAANDVALFNNAGGNTASATEPSVTAYLYGHQVEDVSGQSVKLPGEYVKMTQRAASASLPGYADGVQYFTTTLAGVPIPATTLLGYIPESGATQLVAPVASIRNFTDAAWVASGGDATWLAKGAGVVSLTATGANAVTNSATRVTASGADCVLLQAAPVTAAGAYCTSFLLRRVTGAGGVDITVDGGATWVPVQGLINSVTYSRVQVSQTLALNTARIGLRVRVSGEVIEADFSQLEACGLGSSGCSSPMTGATRAQDTLSFNTAGNFVNANGTLYAEISFIGGDSLSQVASTVVEVFGTTNARPLGFTGGGLLNFSDGAVGSMSSSGTIAQGVTTKVSAAWAASVANGSRITKTGGGASTTTASATGAGAGASFMQLNIGNPGTIAIRNLRFYDKTLTPAQQDTMVA